MREMKDSGIEWIGDIPKVWKLKQLKALLVERKEKNDPVQTHFILSLGANYGVIPYSQKEGGGNKAKEDVSSYRLAYPGDIVMNSMNIISGSVGLSKYFGCVSPVYYMFYPRNRNSKTEYYHYLFQTKVFQHSLLGLGNGILMKESGNGTFNTVRMRIPVEKLNALMLPVPPLNEQERIVVFLDSECAAIDTILEKTRASIDEYKKLKQSVITQAVTKGIRGDRPMKDSGSIWFGNIPVDWDMKKIKYLFHIKKDIAGQEGYTVLSITQKGIMPKDLSKNEGQLAESYSHYQLVNPGDYAMNHMDLLTGWVDISKYTGVTSPDYRVFTLDDLESNNRSFYLYLMQMCYFNRIFYGLGQGVSGMGRWRLQTDKFLNFSIVVPSKDEQQEIADYLDVKCGEIDNLISRKEQYITEIENYKKSLIYEYVTGKKECPAMVQNEDVSNAYPYFPAPVHASSARFAQAVLMSKILEESSKGMGRVKLEKTLFTIENHIGFNFDTEYLREAAGPLDASIYECEKIITRRNKWFSMKTSSYGVSYAPTNDVDKYKKYYAKYFSEYNSEIERIIDVFRNYTTEQAEIIATLFAAWNDAIIDKKQFTDDDIVDDVLNNWHESKRRFPRQVWLRAMNEIRKNHIIPKGYGKHTVMKEMQ